MAGMSIDSVLSAGDLVLLDTTTLIAYLSKDAKAEATSDLAAFIIDDLVRSGRNEAVVSAITVMELLVRPIRQGAKEAHQHILDFLSYFPNLRPLDVDFAVAQEAASLRARYNFAPPDALIIASGIVAQAQHLITNDQEWQKKLRPVAQQMKVCYLEDYLPPR